MDEWKKEQMSNLGNKQTSERANEVTINWTSERVIQQSSTTATDKQTSENAIELTIEKAACLLLPF